MTTITFTGWLRGQLDRDDAVGDLARDAQADASWPTGGRTEADFADYFRRIEASDDATDALAAAFAEYDVIS